MPIYSLYIVNRAGGLIYQHDVSAGLSRLSANEYLVLAGTVHGVFAIASRITPTALKVSSPSPAASTGLKSISTGLNSNSSILSNYSKSSTVTGSIGAVNSNTSGLRSIDTDLFSVYIFQTITGLKFMLITSPGPVGSSSSTKIENTDLNKNVEVAENVLRTIYSLYSDYVMKNPFYSLDMPIRIELFDQKIIELVKTLS